MTIIVARDVLRKNSKVLTHSKRQLYVTEVLIFFQVLEYPVQICIYPDTIVDIL
jgi:hypothetical protein